MDFLTFLSDYEKEDVSGVKRIFESNKAKEAKIIKEAFKSEFPSKKEALFNVTNYFMKKATAPKGIDVSYVKENITEITSKIQNLSEGDIRIIIHNHEGKGGGGMGFADESAKAKKGRGRPKKVPANTGVVYDDAMISDEESYTDENDDIIMDDTNDNDMLLPVNHDDIVADIEGDDDIDTIESGDEEIIADVLPAREVKEEKKFKAQGKPTKLRWSDLVDKVSKQKNEREDLIGELADMDLDEEELKTATDMAESGEIVEDGGKVGKAATIIGKIKKL